MIEILTLVLLCYLGVAAILASLAMTYCQQKDFPLGLGLIVGLLWPLAIVTYELHRWRLKKVLRR